jgi:hypothetical protein
MPPSQPTTIHRRASKALSFAVAAIVGKPLAARLSVASIDQSAADDELEGEGSGEIDGISAISFAPGDDEGLSSVPISSRRIAEVVGFGITHNVTTTVAHIIAKPPQAAL